jgi:hypothetical protein
MDCGAGSDNCAAGLSCRANDEGRDVFNYDIDYTLHLWYKPGKPNPGATMRFGNEEDCAV